MDSSPIVDDQDQTYDDSDDRSWLKLDDAHQVRTIDDQETTIEIVNTSLLATHKKNQNGLESDC